MSCGNDAGRAIAAAPASPARATSRIRASVGRLRETSPIRAAAMAVTRATLVRSTGLSAVPKWCTAHSLTGVGVASITVEPTASTGEAEGFTKAATR